MIEYNFSIAVNIFVPGCCGTIKPHMRRTLVPQIFIEQMSPVHTFHRDSKINQQHQFKKASSSL